MDLIAVDLSSSSLCQCSSTESITLARIYELPGSRSAGLYATAKSSRRGFLKGTRVRCEAPSHKPLSHLLIAVKPGPSHFSRA